MMDENYIDTEWNLSLINTGHGKKSPHKHKESSQHNEEETHDAHYGYGAENTNVKGNNYLPPLCFLFSVHPSHGENQVF